MGHGLSIFGCSNLNIESILSYNNHGDGIYFGISTATIDTGEKIKVSNNNINIGKVHCKMNYRNDISLYSGKNVKVYEMFTEETIGNSPQIGINFEPNNNDKYIDFDINKFKSKNN